MSSTEIQSTISSTSVLRRVRSDAPVLHLHVPRPSTRTRVVRVWDSLLLFIAHLSRMVHRLILLSVSSSSYGLWAHPVHHFHCLPPTPHGISEVNKLEGRPSWSILSVPHLGSVKFRHHRARHRPRTAHGRCTVSCTVTVGAPYLQHHQVQHFSQSFACPSPRPRLTHVVRQSVRGRPTSTTNLIFLVLLFCLFCP